MRVLTLIVLAVLVVVAVVAFNRKWVTFDWANKDDSKSEATVTVDREKISEDVAAAKKSARQTFTRDAATTTVRGTVATVNNEMVQIRTADSQTVDVRLRPDTDVRRAEQRIKPGEIVVGDEVSVEADHGAQGQEARSITVLTKHKDS